jgi:predicted nucleotidyltransferase
MGRSDAGLEELKIKMEPIFATTPEWLFVYVFGSVARQTSGPLSDVDLGVLYASSHPLPSLLDSGRRSIELANAIGARRVDLVVLNEAPVLLRHRVVRDGVVLFCRDQRTRVAWVRDTILEYLDTAPLRLIHDSALSRAIREGRFLDRP